MITEVRLSRGPMRCVDTGRGAPLLLVHGFPLNGQMWCKQLAEFAATQRVLIPDLRGFGASPPTPGTMTMVEFADELAELLTQLAIEEPVTFGGLSMGGYIGWQFWRRHRRKLKRLILCDTRAVADDEETARGRRLTAEKVLREGPAVVAEVMIGRLFDPTFRQLRPEVVAAQREVMLGTSRAGIAAALRGMAERPDVTGELPSIDVPTLLLCGDHDVISTPDEMRRMAAAIPGSQFHVIPAAGHLAPLENPAQVNAVLRQFLAQPG